MAKKKIEDVRKDKKRGVQYAYILDDCFYGDEHNGTCETDKERVWLIIACFKNWDCEHERRKFPILSDRIGDWLRGLPSVCSVDYGYDKIVKIGQAWGMCKTEKAEQRFVNKWYEVLGQRILELTGLLGIEYNKVKPYDDKRTIQEQMADAGC